ncbi:hypothetical protein, partial [Pseudomonas chlororaphis]|uniref:hypothetical protein n=1 Tax=Pseudomonas chlororaphis TaxID=587753 RepID=UPI00406C6CB4
RSNAITGFTTATPPSAGCASGYREMRLLSNFHPAETPKLQLTLRLFCPRDISACGAGARSTGLSLLRQLHNQGVIGPV